MARAAKYIALLGVFLAAMSAAAGAVATQQSGEDAYLASAIAAILVWIAGSVSLALIAMPNTPAARLNAILGGVLVRMGLPLVAMFYFSSTSHPLASNGITGLIVVHFLAGLFVETLLALRMVGHLNAADSSRGRGEIPTS